MKKSVLIALLLGIYLQSYSQTSIDSLVIKIFETWGFDITNQKPGTVPVKLDYKDSVFSYGTHLKFDPTPIMVNVSSDTVNKKDTLCMGFVLTKDKQDTVLNILYCFTPLVNMRPIRDTCVHLLDAFAIQVHLLQEGKYDITLWIDSYNGIPFNDSIKKLSSHTTHFSVAKKNAIENVSETNSLKVFPNPASEQLNVTCGEEMQSLALFNPTGQRVRQMESCVTEAQIPLSGLPSGLYLLKVETAGGIAVRKVVVE